MLIAERVLGAIARYTCECEWSGEHPDRDSYADFCPVCGNEVRATEARDATWVGIALYTTRREYGGPEEGGWYYDAGQLHPETMRCFDLDEGFAQAAQDYYDLLCFKYSEFKHLQVRVTTEEVPVSFPKNRPFYC
jgi:hypothetical protein